MIFKDDPSKKHRSEDSQIAWALREFFFKEDHKPERLILMPMAKAALFQMKAAQEFIKQKKFATLEDGWLVTGASKRGWTSYMVGAAKCDGCVKIAGIMPLVPIVPMLIKEMHH